MLATYDLRYGYQGRTLTMMAVPGDYCSVCDAIILGRDQTVRINTLIRAFELEVAQMQPEVVSALAGSQIRQTFFYHRNKASDRVDILANVWCDSALL